MAHHAAQHPKRVPPPVHDKGSAHKHAQSNRRHATIEGTNVLIGDPGSFGGGGTGGTGSAGTDTYPPGVQLDNTGFRAQNAGGTSTMLIDTGGNVSINAGSIIGSTITGGTVRTSAAFPSVTLTTAGLAAYNSAGVQEVFISASDGSFTSSGISTITGGTFQTSSGANPRLIFDGSGIRGFNASGVQTLTIGSDGSVTISGSSTITGGTFRTSAFNPRLIMDSTGLRALDAGGTTTFNLRSDGSMDLDLPEGSIVVSTAGVAFSSTPDSQTSARVTIDAHGISGYDATNVKQFYLDDTTGLIEATGVLTAQPGSTVPWQTTGFFIGGGNLLFNASAEDPTTVQQLLYMNTGASVQAPVTVNFITNPSFEYDSVGVAPAGWGSTGGMASAVVSNAWSDQGSKSFRLVTLAQTAAGQPSTFALGLDNGPGGQSGFLGWNASRLSTGKLMGRYVGNINSLGGGTWQPYMELWCYDSTGAFISGLALTTSSIVRNTTGVYVATGGVVTLPVNTAWFKVSLSLFCTTAGALDISVDSFGLFFDVTSLPAYVDGDMLGYVWTGVPGNSTTQLAAINFVQNPSFEHDVIGAAPAGWVTSGVNTNLLAGAVLTVVSGSVASGVRSCKIVTDNTVSNEGAAILLGVLAAGTYAVTITLQGNAGGEAVEVWAGNSSAPTNLFAGTLTTSPRTITGTFVADGSSMCELMTRHNATSIVTWFVDAAMITTGSTIPTYVDGDMLGYTWTGTPGNSTTQLNPVFQLQYGTNPSSTTLKSNSTAAQVQAALQAAAVLPTGATVACTGGPLPRTPITITLGNLLITPKILAPVNQALVGGSAVVGPQPVLMYKNNVPISWWSYQNGALDFIPFSSSYHGGNTFRLTSTGMSNPSMSQSVGPWGLKVGTNYTLSAYFRAPVAARKAELVLTYTDILGNSMGSFTVDSSWNTTNDWQRLLVTAPVPATGSSQQIAIVGQPIVGTFQLIYNGQMTAPLAFNVSNASLQSALQALSTVGVGGVLSITGGPLPNTPVQVTFASPPAAAPTLMTYVNNLGAPFTGELGIGDSRFGRIAFGVLKNQGVTSQASIVITNVQSVYIRVQFGVVGALAGEQFYVDGCQLEVGDAPTAFAPQPDEIVANVIQANMINVAQLSAITANLGQITAGTVTGATFQSSTGGARVVMDTAGLRAFDFTGVNQTFTLSATDGSFTATGGTITGAVIRTSSIPTTGGTQMDSSGYKSYDSTGRLMTKIPSSGGLLFLADAGFDAIKWQVDPSTGFDIGNTMSTLSGVAYTSPNPQYTMNMVVTNPHTSLTNPTMLSLSVSPSNDVDNYVYATAANAAQTVAHSVILVNGAGQSIFYGTMQVDGAANFSSSIQANGSAVFASTLQANGAAVLLSNLQVNGTALVGSDAQVNGALSVASRIFGNVSQFPYGGVTLADFNLHTIEMGWTGALLQWYVDGTAVNCASSVALKKNVNTIQKGDALSIINRLRGVTFNWKEAPFDRNRFNYGLLAEEVATAFPSAVHNQPHPNEPDKSQLFLDELPLIAVLVESVKELSSRLERLEQVDVGGALAKLLVETDYTKGQHSALAALVKMLELRHLNLDIDKALGDDTTKELIAIESALQQLGGPKK